MAERVVSVRLQARVEGFTAGMRKAKSSVDDLTKADVPKAAAGYKDLADKAALAGAAVAAGLGVAVKRFADFDKAMSAVRANSGATGAELDSLRQAAIKLGADSQFSATEAAQGINELAKAGVSSQAILQGGLKGALDLAAAGQIEVSQAAETTASALTQFNLTGADSVRVADLLTNGANKAQGGVLDLGQALNQAGLVAAQTGLSVEETTAGLTAFASAGLIGSDAGTSFKTMLQRLTPTSDAAATAMKEIGLDAYDAQGNFIGLEAVAGQLQTGLAKMSKEQQNAALTTIFGSDSVRAASVLYKEGAQGIRDWTSAVTEQGAAAKQAATLTDNLSGDIERLGGAFDSVLIQTGSGANSSLRTLTQGLTGLVEVVGRIPGPLLLAGTGLTAIALAVPRGIVAWKAYQAQLTSVGLSLDAITAKSATAGAAVSALGGAAAVLGVALVGNEIARYAPNAQAATVEVDKLTESLRKLRDGGNGSAGGLGDLFRDSGPFSRDIATMNDALDQFAENAQVAFGQNLTDKAERFGDFGLGVEKFTGQVDQLDASLASLVQAGSADAAAESYQRFVDRLNEANRAGANIDVRGVTALFDQYQGSLKETATSAQGAATQSSTLITVTDDAKESAKEASEAWDRLKDAIDGLGSPIAQQRAANRGFEASIDGVDAALESLRGEYVQQAIEKGKDEKAAEKWADAQVKAAIKSGDAIDITTEAGRRVQAALDAIRTATLEKVEADYQATGSTKAATDAMKDGRQAFIDAATEAGYTKTQAKALADQLGLIPSDVSIIVKQSGAEKAAAEIAAAAVNRESTIWVTSRFRTTDTSAEYRGVGGRAYGGAVYGPGSGTSDTAGLYRLSNGEHVWTAAEVAKVGGQSAMYALRNAVMRGGFPGLAGGGAVPQYAPRVQVVAMPTGAPGGRSQAFDNRINIERLVTNDVRSFRREADQRQSSRYSGSVRAS